MIDWQAHIYLFFIPMIVANVLHMVIVKKNWFPALAIPIAPMALGENKTYRGFIVLPFISGLVGLLGSLLFGAFSYSHMEDMSIGIGLGFAYMLFELPNSYIKRKLGIATGESVEKYRFLQILIDKCDSLIGLCLFYYWVVSISWSTLAQLFLIGLTLHIGLSYLLVVLNVKKTV